MKIKWVLTLVVLVSLVLVNGGRARPGLAEGPSVSQAVVAQAALGTAFTYQGQLSQGGNPVNGTADFLFGLFDSASAGAQIGVTQTAAVVNVSNGLFTVELDFGSNVFNGDARWLEIAVRQPAGSGSYTPLSPRQALTAAPYALYARTAPWSGLTGMPAGFADGVDNDTTYTAGTGLTLAGNELSVSSVPWSGLTGVPAGFADGADNDTTYTAGTGLTLSGNQFSADLAGSGSASTAARSDHDHNSSYWRLGGNSGVSPSNSLGTTDNVSLILKVNNIPALRLEPNGSTSPNVIGGYSGNSVAAGTYGATIAGGGATGYANNVAGGYGTVGGGYRNYADGAWATVAGGNFNTASGLNASVGGGYSNSAGGDKATVGGGTNNFLTGGWSTIGGGAYNTGNGDYATIAGGYQNAATGNQSTVAGGRMNMASGGLTTVSGGFSNTVSSSAGTVGGGQYNSITNGSYSTIGGGDSNEASNAYATIGGGYNSTASGHAAAIGGGWTNTASGDSATVTGGSSNIASNVAATVGGGMSNTASGNSATVPGGSSNTALGLYSFAAGRRAKANHSGSFVWADGLNFDFYSTASNQFNARATGGARFATNIDGWGNAIAGVNLAAGGGSWTSLSDRDAKEGFTPVDAPEILARLANIPIQTWSYKSQDPAIRHIGPVAQDFYAAFGVGEDERGISTVDADGVALAAIQGLYQVTQEKDTVIAQLQAQNVTQQQTIDDLQKRMSALESQAAGGSAPSIAGNLLSGGWGALGLVLFGGLAVWKVSRRSEE